MATVPQLLAQDGNGVSNGIVAETVTLAKREPTALTALLAPLSNSGFTDFRWVGAGSNSFLIAPVDNDDIVFRISSEFLVSRSDNNPFFLAAAYEDRVAISGGGELKLEMLLAGGTDITDTHKQFLIDEMRQAGWKTNNISNKWALWKDVVIVDVRDAQNRKRSVPVISDPSAERTVEVAMPSYGSDCNRAGPNYITMQDQARTYNAARERDPRLKILIPQTVDFPQTTVLAQTADVGRLA